MMARKAFHEEWLQWRLVVRQRKVSFEYKKKQAFRAKEEARKEPVDGKLLRKNIRAKRILFELTLQDFY